MASSKSWITPLPDCTFEIAQLLRDHGARVQRKEPFNPRSGVLPLAGPNQQTPQTNPTEATTVVPASEPPVATTPMDGRQDDLPAAVGFTDCIENDPPSSHTVEFRVMRTSPPIESDLSCLCTIHDGTMYGFVVHLKDDTGTQLDAIVSNESGEALLGIAATNATKVSSDVAKEKHVRLTKSRFKGEIRSVSMKGAIYFVLASAERLDE